MSKEIEKDNKKEIFVQMKGITKTFGSVIANKDAKLRVMKGEIYALLGENGAGKSTLMNMLSGIYYPTEGEIFIKGKKVSFSSPNDAIKAGVGMIHQHFKLIDIFSARDNIIMGQKENFFLSKKKINQKLISLSKKFGLPLDPDKKIYQMSVGEKQNVEILKVLYRGADILILDEPTAVLTPQEIKKLFVILRKMKEEGCAIIIITHKLNEIMEISDFVTVMNNGKTVGSVKTSESDINELTRLMVGKKINLEINRPIVEKKDQILTVKNLSVKDEIEKVTKLKSITFKMYSGEILGVAGVAGSGQKELCEAMAGIIKPSTGEILYKGENIIGKNSRQIFEMGISMSFIPEDRLGMGLIAGMDMTNNVILKDYYKQKGLFLKRRYARTRSTDLIKKLDIKTPSINHPVKLLSGGNIQKILLGREIGADPHVLITAYPTRGLDIGSSHLIYDLLNEQKEKGIPILYIGEDLDVLLELCDKIVVLFNGEITGIVNADKVTKEDLGLLMAGVVDKS